MTGFNDNYIGGVLGGYLMQNLFKLLDGLLSKKKGSSLYLISLYSY